MHLKVYPFMVEQKLNVIDIKFNEQQTLGLVENQMDSPRFPDIHLDLLLKRTEDGNGSV